VVMSDLEFENVSTFWASCNFFVKSVTAAVSMHESVEFSTGSLVVMSDSEFENVSTFWANYKFFCKKCDKQQYQCMKV
jgi:hypothetical protein